MGIILICVPVDGMIFSLFAVLNIQTDGVN